MDITLIKQNFWLFAAMAAPVIVVLGHHLIARKIVLGKFGPFLAKEIQSMGGRVETVRAPTAARRRCGITSIQLRNSSTMQWLFLRLLISRG